MAHPRLSCSSFFVLFTGFFRWSSLFGYPFCLRVDLTKSICSCLSLSWLQSLSTRCSSVFSTAHIVHCASGCSERKSRYLPVCVSFRCTLVLTWPCSTRVINVSRKATESVILYCLRRTTVSSTYRFLSFGPDIKVFSGFLRPPLTCSQLQLMLRTTLLYGKSVCGYFHANAGAPHLSRSSSFGRCR